MVRFSTLRADILGVKGPATSHDINNTSPTYRKSLSENAFTAECQIYGARKTLAWTTIDPRNSFPI